MSVIEGADPGWTWWVERWHAAAWVAAIDRMAVGGYVQRRDALGDRAGQPISPRTGVRPDARPS